MSQPFTAESIRSAMKRVYQWQRANQKRTVIRRSGKTRFIKDTDWERGVFWSCVAAAWLATDDSDYLDGILNYTLHTGFCTGPKPRFADDLVCTQAYLDIYNQINQPEALESTIAFIDTMLNDPKPGREDWWWCDALFMAPPAFATLARHSGEQRYLDYMHRAWWDSVEHLRDPETGLFYRDQRYIPDGNGSEMREANGAKVFWSRGEGWVLAAIARILERLPQDDPERPRYSALLQSLTAAVVPYQHQDGFWRASLLDPDSFPAPESSATALFCYGIAWGVAHSILDRATYQPHAERAWQALLSAIHDDGMLGWVQLPAFNPRDVAYEHNIDYGAGAFLLAGTAMLALEQ